MTFTCQAPNTTKLDSLVIARARAGVYDARMAHSHVVFAFDKQTARSFDADGRMRVKNCILSTAEVNPYRGSEVPGADKLGLSPNTIYELYRDPDELRKAAASFEGVPLMIKHVPQTADEPRKEYQAGSVHSITFDGKHLRGDLLVSDGKAIELIESGELADLSCGYRYTPDMKAGKTAQGQAFDGTMRDIQGNHVALVDDGRASGAHVADRALSQTGDTAMAGENEIPPGGAPGSEAGEQHEQSAMAQVGAALKHIAELLENIHGQMNGNGQGAEPSAAAAPGPTGNDADDMPGEPKPENAEDGELEPAVKAGEGAMDEDGEEAEGAMDEDDMPAQAEQEGTPARGEKTPTGAMDAKSVQKYAQSLVNAAVKRERLRAAAVEQARRDTRGVLGDAYALDSASAIYRTALEAVGIDPANVPKGMARVAWQTHVSTAARAAGVRPQAEMAMDNDAIGKQRSGVLSNISRIKIVG